MGNDNPSRKEGLTVTAYQGTAATSISGVTDSQGKAVLVLTDGSYHFETTKMGVTRASNADDTCVIPSCNEDSITLPTFSQVTVTVLDNASAPQADIPVFAYTNGQQTGYNGVTDANGQVTLTVPQGNYRFRATTHSLNYFSGVDDHCATPDCTSASVTVPQFSNVTVTVADTASAFVEGAVVTAYTSENGSEVSAGISGTTDANGQAVLTLPTGSYLFKTIVHTVEYTSGTAYECTTPTCTAAAIQTAVFGDVTVTVSDVNNAAQAGVTVIALNGDTITSFQAVTGENGQAVLTLPEGSNRFRAVAHGLSFNSAETNHCTVTGCSTASISIPVIAPVTITVLNAVNAPQANMPVVAYRVVETVVEEEVPTATPTPEVTPTGEATSEPTAEPTPEPEDNIMTLTELVETGIQGTTDANGQVTLYLPADTYRFRADIYGHQYFSEENALTVVPTDATASVTVPVFGEVTVTVADSDHEPVPDLAVYAYLGLDEYVGISGGTGEFGRVTLMLPEGTYRFKTEQYGIEFWSSQTANCNTPSECSEASITVIGRDYLANEQTIDYTYDDLNRLTAADYDLGLYYHYEYDSIGNRLSQETAYNNTPVATAYTYDDANRITAVGAQAYTYDANGNLTSDGTYTYQFDTANRMTGLTANGVTTNYQYNGLGNMLVYTNTDGNYRGYTLDINTTLPVIIKDNYLTHVYGLDHLGYEVFDEYSSLLPDALGSVRQRVLTRVGETSSFNWINSTTTYDPYGNVIMQAGDYLDHGFAGEFQDTTLDDLVYLRARHYSPRTGTFLSRDTWDGDANSPMSYNRWMYGYSNPVKYTDPSGKTPQTIISKVGNNYNQIPSVYVEMSFLQDIICGNNEAKQTDLTGYLAVAMSHHAHDARVKEIRDLLTVAPENAQLPQIVSRVEKAYLLFYELEGGGKEWDIKIKMLDEFKIPAIILCGSINCFWLDYSTPGNIHFGYIAGLAEIDHGIAAVAGGGLEQLDIVTKDHQFPKLDYCLKNQGIGFCDNPADQAAVDFGYELAKKRKYRNGISEADLRQELSISWLLKFQRPPIDTTQMTDIYPQKNSYDADYFNN